LGFLIRLPTRQLIWPIMKSSGRPMCYPLMKQVLDFFSILAFFNHISRNEPGQNFFLNLALLSRVMCTGATYEGVAPVHMA
jgi:hypothetical protein